MKIDQHGKNICKLGMHVFLLMATYLSGDLHRPFVDDAPPEGKVFLIMMIVVFSLIFGALAYLTEREE